jgi:hypothetical protein
VCSILIISRVSRVFLSTVDTAGIFRLSFTQFIRTTELVCSHSSDGILLGSKFIRKARVLRAIFMRC